jgi:hypothetical protein
MPLVLYYKKFYPGIEVWSKCPVVFNSSVILGVIVMNNKKDIQQPIYNKAEGACYIIFRSTS